MNVAITGYYGTGSSAVLGLLSEYEGCSEGGLHPYEHIPLYTPDGLFDLEHKLLLGNDVHRSDEAIKRFRRAMYRLNDNYYAWFGSYRDLFGDRFRQIVDTYLGAITQYTCPGEWYDYYQASRFSPKKLLKDCVKTLLPGKTVRGPFGKEPPKVRTQQMELSFLTPQEFYDHSKQFIRDYCAMVNRDNSPVLLLDHLLFPHNAYKIDNYFDDDFRLIIVERDVRDMFVLCKYVWARMGIQSPYPSDPEAFLQLWNAMRASEQRLDHPHILRVQFEDLIYDYDRTVAKIEAFVGLRPEQHIRPKESFDPAKSINNTQNFRIEPQWEAEIASFEGRTPDIYPFPYLRTPDIRDTFDN